MRKIILVLTFSIAFVGCTTETPKNSESNAAAKNNAGNAESNFNANKSAETKAQPILKGEKIEKPLEVKFESSGLPTGWQKVDTNKENPAEFDTSGGVLKLKIPGGTDLFGEHQNAPRLLKP